MSLLIKNGEVVTADARYFADIYVEEETITRIGKDLAVSPDTEVIDAAGKFVFPGFIDPHVHIYLPFMSTFAKDSHATASVAALIGGTTTFIEMCCPSRLEDALDGYHLWKEKAAGQSACDYAFHAPFEMRQHSRPVVYRQPSPGLHRIDEIAIACAQVQHYAIGGDLFLQESVNQCLVKNSPAWVGNKAMAMVRLIAHW